jgi:hypothetical protein
MKSSALATHKAAGLSGTSIVSHPDHLYQVHLFERFSLNLGPEGQLSTRCSPKRNLIRRTRGLLWT